MCNGSKALGSNGVSAQKRYCTTAIVAATVHGKLYRWARFNNFYIRLYINILQL